MATQAQQSANAANSRRSTGPTTAAGKQKAAQNSARHYLTAKQLVVPGEDPADYTELHQGLHQSWIPANAQESILVEQIAQNAWRLMRARRLEAALFIRTMPSLEPVAPAYPGALCLRTPANPEVAMLRAFLDNTKEFDNLRRYTTPIERAYHIAISELTKLQKQRRIHEIGSVSQTPEPKPIHLGHLAAQAVKISNATTRETAFTAHSDTIQRTSGT